MSIKLQFMKYLSCNARSVLLRFNWTISEPMIGRVLFRRWYLFKSRWHSWSCLGCTLAQSFPDIEMIVNAVNVNAINVNVVNVNAWAVPWLKASLIFRWVYNMCAKNLLCWSGAFVKKKNNDNMISMTRSFPYKGFVTLLLYFLKSRTWCWPSPLLASTPPRLELSGPRATRTGSRCGRQTSSSEFGCSSTWKRTKMSNTAKKQWMDSTWDPRLQFAITCLAVP